jgi:hypothetical protein
MSLVPYEDEENKGALENLQKKLSEYCEAEGVERVRLSAAWKFLLARDGDVDDAFTMAVDTINWRASSCRERLASAWGASRKRAAIEPYLPMGGHSTDRRGCPVYVERPGLYDATGLLRVLTEFEIQTHHCYKLDVTEKDKVRLEGKDGEFAKHYVVLDMTGVSLSSFAGEFVGITRRLIGLDEKYYPENPAKLFVINAPWVFSGIFKVIRPWLQERTQRKVAILDSSFLSTVSEVIDPANFPNNLGGTCSECEGGKCFSDGGAIPTDLYRTSVPEDTQDLPPVTLVKAGHTSTIDLTIGANAAVLLPVHVGTCSAADEPGVGIGKKRTLRLSLDTCEPDALRVSVAYAPDPTFGDDRIGMTLEEAGNALVPTPAPVDGVYYVSIVNPTSALFTGKLSLKLAKKRANVMSPRTPRTPKGVSAG